MGARSPSRRWESLACPRAIPRIARSREGQSQGAGNSPAVGGDEALVPSEAVELLQPPIDDHLAVECLGPGLVADPGRIEGGHLRPLLESRPDSVPFELRELRDEQKPEAIHGLIKAETRPRAQPRRYPAPALRRSWEIAQTRGR